ncbi:MAG: DoxX family protein [Chlorobi bacterium]|nr:MAG: DoxX family protein [Bacteroidota bacterium]MBE2265467.1 DoxX family protein [Flavobacteriales bacterium]MBL1160531.1 DoxX family protein [Chlorobiota bacterium]MBW7853220.1 DoxX family protein [Candidatus Kapabacteria bacterium]MCC6331291.1 DoxX family protein [Ignavibacteria bacterium]
MMTKLFQPFASERLTDVTVLILRVSFAFLLITHGFPKLSKLLGEQPIEFAAVFGMSPGFSLTMAMLAEFGCAVLLALGLFTRIAAIPIFATMMVIFFHIHSGMPLSNRELPLVYLVLGFFFMVHGAGNYSLDAVLSKKLTHSARNT